MNLRMAGAVSAMLVAGAANAQNAVQWRVEDGGNGHWYLLVDTGDNQTWLAARDAAVAASGHLATLASEPEDLFVRHSFMPTIQFGPLGPWLGGFQDLRSPSYSEPNGGWVWVTEEPWTWALWDRPGDAEPNNAQCGPENFLHLAVDVGDGRWNDLGSAGCTGTGSRGAIIEWDADCNSDGIVDYGQIRSGELADANANNVPDCCENGTVCGCPADIVQDGAVNGVDLAAVINAWGTNGGALPRSDVNHDGIVNGADLAQVLGSWGACP